MSSNAQHLEGEYWQKLMKEIFWSRRLLPELKFYNFVSGSESRAQAGPQLLSDEEATGETSTPDHSLDLCYSGHKLWVTMMMMMWWLHDDKMRLERIYVTICCSWTSWQIDKHCDNNPFKDTTKLLSEVNSTANMLWDSFESDQRLSEWVAAGLIWSLFCPTEFGPGWMSFYDAPLSPLGQTPTYPT